MSRSPSTHPSGSIPGSRTERSLLESFSRMMSELLRFSSGARLLEHIPEALQAAHRPSGDTGTPVGVPVPAASVTAEPDEPPLPEDEDVGDDLLAGLGF